MDAIFAFLTYLLIFGSILFLAYVSTRYIGMKAGNVVRGKNLKVIESLSLGIDKGLFLVRAGKQILLLSSSGKNIELLTTLSEDDLEEIIEEPGQQRNAAITAKFSKYLESFKNYLKVEDRVEGKTGIRDDGTGKERTFNKNLEKLRNIYPDKTQPDKKNGGNEL